MGILDQSDNVVVAGHSLLNSQSIPTKLFDAAGYAFNMVGSITGAPSTDGMSGSAHKGMVNSEGMEWNGTNWDKRRNNIEGTLLASAARSATQPFPNQTNYNAKGVKVIVRVSAIGTGNLTPAVRGIDPASGFEYNLLGVVTAITATGIYVYEVLPNASGTTPEIVQAVSHGLPRSWTGRVTHLDASLWTYSVGYQYNV